MRLAWFFQTSLVNLRQVSPKHTFVTSSLGLHDQHLTEWHSIHPSSDILRIVARLSTRIFLGEELCRNDKWLDASAIYAKVAFHAVEVLRRYPPALRPWVASFVPEVRAARACMANCREIMSPFVAQRYAMKAEAIAGGKEPPRYDDSLEWFEKENGTNFDPTNAQ